MSSEVCSPCLLISSITALRHHTEEPCLVYPAAYHFTEEPRKVVQVTDKSRSEIYLTLTPVNISWSPHLFISCCMLSHNYLAGASLTKGRCNHQLPARYPFQTICYHVFQLLTPHTSSISHNRSNFLSTTGGL